MNRHDNQNTLSSRRMLRAVDYVSNNWIPCDQDLLQQINKILKHDKGFDDTTKILSLVQSDVSLYLFTLQRLYKLLSAEGVQIDEDLSANDFIIEGGVDLVRLIFDDQTMLRTPHSLSSGDDVQRFRVFESLISASSAQMLAPTYGIESHDGYAGALVRQLGLLLIAWNYPTAYAHAIRVEKEGGSLIATLSENLGFTPEILTIEVLQRWGLSKRVTEKAFGITDGSVEAKNGNALSELYSASEALARANFPELYPSVRADWNSARDEITKRLGGAGLEAIQLALEEHLAHYRKNVPTLFSPGLVLDPMRRISSSERSASLSSNPYVPLCADSIRESFERIYSTVSVGGRQEWLLRELLKELIPLAGFRRGCVYTVDPDRLKLVPQVAVGNSKRFEYQSHDLTLSSGTNDIVPLAYLSPQPIVEFHLDPASGSCVNRIAGFVGINNRLGVLYLEIDGDEYDQNSTLIFNQFKAIQHALSDCLGS